MAKRNNRKYAASVSGSQVWQYLPKHGDDGVAVLLEAAQFAEDEGGTVHCAMHRVCAGSTPIASAIARAWVWRVDCQAGRRGSYTQHAPTVLRESAADLQQFIAQHWPRGPQPAKLELGRGAELGRPGSLRQLELAL